MDHIKSWLLSNYDQVEGSLEEGFYRFKVNGKAVEVDASTLEAKCDDSETAMHVKRAIERIVESVAPHVII